MTNLTTTKGNFSLVPTSLHEAMEYAKMMASSTIIPKSFQGKPSDIVVAVQMGMEIGLKPLQSLLNIAVVNGKPALYGDALIALVQAHPMFENIEEYYDEKLKAAVCKVKRKNQSEHVVTYSEDDAKQAGLWGKVSSNGTPSPWKLYPKRMLQMRARGFALRDKFADSLSGIISIEEAQDYPVDVTPKSQFLNSKIDRVIEDSNLDIIENEQELFLNDQEKIVNKTFMELCSDNKINAKQFAIFHNITSEKPETVKYGIENFELLKKGFEDAQIDNTH